MADVAALDAAHPARLPDRERREVVVVPVELFRLQAERVEAHLLLERAHRDDAQRLRLPAREQRRAVRARQHADLDRDVADLVLRATVRALLLDRDALADDLLLELVEGELRGLRGAPWPRASCSLAGPFRSAPARTARGSPPRRPWSRPGARACPRPAWPRRASRRARRGSARAARASTWIGSNSFFGLPTFAARSRCSAQSFLISAWAMSSASRISASGISLAPASTIRIASSVPATTRSRSEASSASSSSQGSSGLTTKLPSILPMRTAPTGVGSGMSEIISAAEAPFIARMSYGWTWSIDSGIATSCVS